MDSLSERLEKLKEVLKNQWLDYYAKNKSWLPGITYRDRSTGNKINRPNSYLVLGVITALEPRLNEILFHFSLVTDNADRIIEVLGLDFDPEKELEKRAETQQSTNENSSDPDAEYLNKIRQENN